MIKLIHGDCLEEMKHIESGSIDMILCDLPYGTTACKWDTVIPFEPLWEQYKRIIKKNGAIILFGSQPFTSALIMSNLKMFKYCWVWEKAPFNFLNSSHQPLRNNEDVAVFSNGKTIFNAVEKDIIKYKTHGEKFKKTESVGNYKFNYKSHEGFARPTTIIKGIKKEDTRKIVHPTQKPVALLEYLIKTYTNELEIVLDNCMGSGSTGVAAQNLIRSFIGIEKDENYFNIAKERINNSQTN